MSPRTGRRYQSIVDRVEHVARLHSGEPMHIRDLCQICDVTERTLRNAFKTIRGKTPYRYLRTARMQDARQALLRARPLATVTLIATQFGFLELGRFSVEYRSIFGECPSETLRQSRLAGTSPPLSLRSDSCGTDAVNSTRTAA